MESETLVIPAQKTPFFSFPAHTVTWKPSPRRATHTLDPQDATLFFSLHEQATTPSKKTLKTLEHLLDKYPTHPEILNLAASLYLFSKKQKKANHCIERNYAANPNYLFAKINYADLCLRRKKSANIPAIFNHKESLVALYPQRAVFHVSEFRGFVTVMGLYALALNNRNRASCYHYLAYRIDPHHPSTRVLQKKIYALPWHYALVARLFPSLVKKKLSASSHLS